MLVNARMSDRSFGRWRRIPGFARQILGRFTHIRARGEQDAERLLALGATSVESPGDLKFAAPPLPVDQAELHRLTSVLNGRPVWLAASTHPGEEALIAAAHRALIGSHPGLLTSGLLTIIVPRHPERGVDARGRTEGAPPVRRSGSARTPGASGSPTRWVNSACGIVLRRSPLSDAA